MILRNGTLHGIILAAMLWNLIVKAAINGMNLKNLQNADVYLAVTKSNTNQVFVFSKGYQNRLVFW